MGGGADVETGAAEYDAEAIDDDEALLPPAEDEDPDDIMSEVLASAAEISAEMKTLRAVVTCNGETFQMRAIDKVVNGAEAAKLESLEFMKFPAACSFIFQPCDVQPGFRTLKRKAAGADDDDASMYSVPAWMEDGFVQKILAALDPSSRRTYAEFPSRLPTYLHAAFTPSTGQGVMDCIPSLALKAAKGYLSPQEILAEISPFLPVTMYTTADEVDLMSLSLNRWLATWVNKEGTVARIEQNKQRRREAAQEAVERVRGRQQRTCELKDAKQAEENKRAERGRCSGCVVETKEIATNKFKKCGYKGCNKIFCPGCVTGHVMETHMDNGCAKKPQPVLGTI
ncbi:hypothetical protein B484DRAFT_408543 [Ochromonadaceae sp. CCMP2298]|nr:hypothetical protein B484DRAFT_408543 [Ochromonadaceae sp. CCMP2298]